MIKLKYCGFTNPEDVEHALKLGIEYIGFIFYIKSHRYVKPEELQNWCICQ